MSRPLVMPSALPDIARWEDDPASRKLGCYGRRSGKSRGMFRMAVLGHGPRDEQGEPMLPGLAQQGDVLWLGPDYKQLSIIWTEEIKPRFGAADGCWTKESGVEGLTAGLGGARLILRTTENLNAIKGAGAKVAGIVIDEGAHMDLATILKEAVIPVLLDNGGWLVIGSTPNMANDGHTDELGNKTTPSYFNSLADAVQRGERTGWAFFEGDARANPKVSKAAFAELVAEYDGPDDPKLLQEVYAKRIAGGVGTAFGQLNERHHALPADWTPPPKARTFLGMDWGWSQPGWIGLFVALGNRAVLWREWPFNGPKRDKEPPADVGRRLARELRAICGPSRANPNRPQFPSTLYYDSAMASLTDGAESTIDRLEDELLAQLRTKAPVCVPATKGSGSRHARKELLDTMLRTKEHDGVVVESPRLQIVKGLCPVWWAEVTALPRAPRDPEDVDTDAADHAYDGSTYALIMEYPSLRKKRTKRRPKTGDRLSDREHRRFDAMADAAAARIAATQPAARGRVLGGG